MADTQTIDWNEINADEEVSETDQKASENLSLSAPVGKFLCKAVTCEAVEKELKKYSCHAANIKFEIAEVLEIEQPIIGEDTKPVKRNGEVVMKVQKIADDKKDHFNDLHVGKFLFDDIFLPHPLEKDGFKKRRLFVAKKFRLIDAKATELKTSAWQNVPGKFVVMENEHNSWEDAKTKEIKSNVKVKWDGYDYAPSDIKTDEKSDNDEDFGDI